MNNFLDYGNNLMVFVFTETEYNAMLKETNNVFTQISGSIRSNVGWYQTIGSPTMQDGINKMAWHISKGHARCDDKLVAVMFPIALDNWISHSATRKVNTHQRGYTTQYVQVLDGHNYVLSEEELGLVTILKIENYNPTQIYARWSFGNGFLYSYGTPINVLSAIEAGMDNPIITVLTQAVSNAGIRGINLLPQHVLQKLSQHYAELNMTLPKSTVFGEEQVGHPGHVTHILMHNEELYNTRLKQYGCVDIEVDEED